MSFSEKSFGLLPFKTIIAKYSTSYFHIFYVIVTHIYTYKYIYTESQQ